MNSLITIAIRRRILAVLLLLLAMGAGVAGFSRLGVGAPHDLVTPRRNPATTHMPATGEGSEVYHYRVVAPAGYSIMDLKTLQDWMLNPRLKAVPGVIDVSAEPQPDVAGQDGVVVDGIILLRGGAENMPATKRVTAEIDKIINSDILPPGISIERVYDHADTCVVACLGRFPSTSTTVIDGGMQKLVSLGVGVLLGSVLIFFVVPIDLLSHRLLWGGMEEDAAFATRSTSPEPSE